MINAIPYMVFNIFYLNLFQQNFYKSKTWIILHLWRWKCIILGFSPSTNTHFTFISVFICTIYDSILQEPWIKRYRQCEQIVLSLDNCFSPVLKFWYLSSLSHWGNICSDVQNIILGCNSYIHNSDKSKFQSLYSYFLTEYLHFKNSFNSLMSCPHGIMTKVLNCGLKISEFKFQSRYYPHFWTNTLWKGI